MKKRDVRLGGTYSAKISGRIVPCRLESVNESGGWDALNLKTGRRVRIKSAAKLRDELEVPAPVRTVRATCAVVNTLRTARHHLAAQVEAGVSTNAATLAQARVALDETNARLASAEAELRDVPEAAYLFGARRRTRTRGVQTLPTMAISNESPMTKEETVARKSKTAQLDEALAALKKAEKSAGSTKWALSGAGAAKNPPSPERKAHLEEKLEREQATIAELRAQRDALKA